MDFAESNATPGMNAACESVQNSPVILLPLYERVINIIERHSEYAPRMVSTSDKTETA